ncbi:aminoglycoside phosphotransferase family protein [Micromonospora sp. NPDC050980]|uniref:aminoglycoside phosphotransferase family protein n=1 Tax=Micromonospora sp. NPDC050980 TaxID=3155161 RepID=UPI003411C188
MTNLSRPGDASPALGRDAVSTVLHAICDQVGLESAGARLIKFTNNAVLDLPHEPIVVRIAGSQTVRDRVSKVITVAEWLARHRMPAVRLFPGINQPVEAYGHLATLWWRVSSTGRAPTGAHLGRILRRYHSLPPPETPLPPWRPLVPIRQRIAETDGLPQEVVTFLETKCEQLEEAVARLEYALPAGPIHGDSFLGNLIPGPEGAVICDFDSAAYGPREWDLTPVAVGELRFGYPGNPQKKLAMTYGFDITGWSGFPIFRQLRELQLVTSVLPVLRGNPSLGDQWRHRMRTFRNGDLDAAWTPYR